MPAGLSVCLSLFPIPLPILYLSFCLPIYLSIYLPTCLLVYRASHLSTYLNTDLPIHRSTNLSTDLSIDLSTHQSINLSVGRSKVYLFFCLPIYLAIYPKRSQSAKLPPKMDAHSSKTKHFCETSSQIIPSRDPKQCGVGNSIFKCNNTS